MLFILCYHWKYTYLEVHCHNNYVFYPLFIILRECMCMYRYII